MLTNDYLWRNNARPEEVTRCAILSTGLVALLLFMTGSAVFTAAPSPSLMGRMTGDAGRMSVPNMKSTQRLTLVASRARWRLDRTIRGVSGASAVRAVTGRASRLEPQVRVVGVLGAMTRGAVLDWALRILAVRVVAVRACGMTGRGTPMLGRVTRRAGSPHFSIMGLMT